MNRNNNPLFAMIPSTVLAKAKALADEFRAQERVEDLVWRHIGLVVVGFALAIAFNIANGFTFSFASHDLFAFSAPLTRAAAIYGVLVILCGLLFTGNAFVAALELISYRKANPSSRGLLKKQRLFRPATWGPLVPFVILPSIFNAFFSVHYFFALVSAGFLAVIVVVLATDV